MDKLLSCVRQIFNEVIQKYSSSKSNRIRRIVKDAHSEIQSQSIHSALSDIRLLSTLSRFVRL